VLEEPGLHYLCGRLGKDSSLGLLALPDIVIIRVEAAAQRPQVTCSAYMYITGLKAQAEYKGKLSIKCYSQTILLYTL